MKIRTVVSVDAKDVLAQQGVRSVPLIRNCEHCGGEFAVMQLHQKWCSHKCCNAHHNQGRNRAVPKHLSVERICDECQANYLTKRKGQRFCSPQCGRRHWKASNRPKVQASRLSERQRQQLIARIARQTRRVGVGEG